MPLSRYAISCCILGIRPRRSFYFLSISNAKAHHGFSDGQSQPLDTIRQAHCAAVIASVDSSSSRNSSPQRLEKHFQTSHVCLWLCWGQCCTLVLPSRSIFDASGQSHSFCRFLRARAPWKISVSDSEQRISPGSTFEQQCVWCSRRQIMAVAFMHDVRGV